MEQIELGEITIDVVKKNIKNLHLSVYPPTGKVRISAPLWMDLDKIRVFAITKLGWIKSHQQKLREQDRETPREYLDRESHYVWGKRYLLKVEERDAAPDVELKHNTMILRLRPATSKERTQAILDGWYREKLKGVAVKVIAKWEPLMGVKVEKLFVQKMKTRWGSCNSRIGRIRLNTELAKKRPECLEYVIVHEMVHLLEPSHNKRFQSLMDQFMPKWQFYRSELNKMPVGHEEWTY